FPRLGGVYLFESQSSTLDRALPPALLAAGERVPRRLAVDSGAWREDCAAVGGDAARGTGLLLCEFAFHCRGAESAAASPTPATSGDVHAEERGARRRLLPLVAGAPKSDLETHRPRQRGDRGGCTVNVAGGRSARHHRGARSQDTGGKDEDLRGRRLVIEWL